MQKTFVALLFTCTLYLSTKAQAHLSPIDTLHLDAWSGLYNIVVSVNDSIRYNKHFNSTKDADVFDDQSLTKSMGSLLIGIALDKGLIPSLDTKLTTWFPQLKTDKDKRKQEITLREVMNQASGLRHEDLDKPNGIGEFLSRQDMAGFVLDAPMITDPGTTFHYNNAATHLLGIILTRASGMDVLTFAKKNLLDPLDITAVEWAKAKDGYYDLSGLENIRLRTADWTKIGALLLHEGRYHQKQIVPAKWIARIIHPEVHYATPWGFHGSQYGLCWYHIRYKGKEMVYGLGWGGQFLIVVPGLQMVLAINQTKEDQNAIRRAGHFLESVFPVFFDEVAAHHNLR